MISAFHAALAGVDHLGVRTTAVGIRHRRRHDQQANKGALRLDAAGASADSGGRLGTTLGVSMRLPLIADEPFVDRLNHALRNVGVQIQSRHDRHIRADDLRPSRRTEPSDHPPSVVGPAPCRRSTASTTAPPSAGGSSYQADQRRSRARPHPSSARHRRRLCRSASTGLTRPSPRRSPASRRHRRRQQPHAGDNGIAFEIGAGFGVRLRGRSTNLYIRSKPSSADTWR